MEFPVYVFLAITIIYILMICAHSLEWTTPQASCTVTICGKLSRLAKQITEFCNYVII